MVVGAPGADLVRCGWDIPPGRRHVGCPCRSTDPTSRCRDRRCRPGVGRRAQRHRRSRSRRPDVHVLLRLPCGPPQPADRCRRRCPRSVRAPSSGHPRGRLPLAYRLRLPRRRRISGCLLSVGFRYGVVVLVPNLIDGSGIFVRFGASFQSWPAMPFVLVGSVMVGLGLYVRGEAARRIAIVSVAVVAIVFGKIAYIALPDVPRDRLSVGAATAGELARVETRIPPNAEVISSEAVIGRFASATPSTPSWESARRFPSVDPWWSSCSLRRWASTTDYPAAGHRQRSPSPMTSSTPAFSALAPVSTLSPGHRHPGRPA